MTLFSVNIKLTYRLITITSIIVLCLSAKEFSSYFLEYREADREPLSSPVIQQPKKPKSIEPKYHRITDFHLFGRVITKKAAPKKVKPISAPETRLKISLQGLVFDSQSKRGYAIVSQPGKAPKSYKLGETLPGNAVIHSMEKNHIILARNNRFETLSIKHKDGVKNMNDRKPDTLSNAFNRLNAQARKSLM